jgi:hypothetical protein
MVYYSIKMKCVGKKSRATSFDGKIKKDGIPSLERIAVLALLCNYFSRESIHGRLWEAGSASFHLPVSLFR